jgi:ribokinase
MGRVIVVGSVNVDLVVRVAELPGPGVTVSGGDLGRHDGGKGGNQAVAAARMDAQVAFVGAVGRDELGDSARDALAREGIDVSQLAVVDRPTGVALIVVDAAGQNQIAVAGGANQALDADAVEAAMAQLRPAAGDVLLASREVPDEAIRAALQAGRDAGATTVLNPAPAVGLPAETLLLADWLTPNEHELEQIGGRSADGGWLAVTLGARGAELVAPDGRREHHPAPSVQPIDTTGAGDTFNGALAAMLAHGREPSEAVRLAVAAASLSTMRAGAREGMPTLAAVLASTGTVAQS